jgi:CheY-like chemotaxis protein
MYAPATTHRVLLVEDDDQSRNALQTILRDEGFDVAVASDGDEGLSLVSSFQPDVIVLDLVLPRMNGFDAASVLKSDSATATIPLLAVTASWLGSESSRLRAIGFAGALRKPFPATALIDELKKLLIP